MKKIRLFIFVAVCCGILSACGGGGGGGGGVAPTVTATNPANGATGVATSTTVSATFSKNMGSASFQGKFNVSKGGVNTAGSVSTSGVTATFTPAANMCLFAKHTATIAAGVKDTDGNALASDYAWSFTTGDGTWDARPVTISASSITPQPVISPHAGMDDSGNVIAVWLEDDANIVAKVMANRYTPTAGWGTPVRINSTTNTVGRIGLNPPRIAINGSGNAVAVWQEGRPLQQGGTLFKTWSSRYNATTGQWSAAQILEATSMSSNPAYTPDVGIDSSGNAIAVWVYSVSSWFNPTYASRYAAATGTWSAPVDITTGGLINSNSAVPKIAMNGSGKAVVAGSTPMSSVEYRVWAASFDGTSWGLVAVIDGVIGAGGGGTLLPTPQVSMNDNGDAIAVWDQKANGARQEDIWANRYSGASSSWGTAAIIGPGDTGTGNDATEPQVAIDSSGNAIAVWHLINVEPEIRARRYVVGAGWGTIVGLDATTGFDMHPQIAADNNGNALAVWSNQGKAYAKRYIAGTGWGATITTLEANSNAANAENSPIAMNKGCGNAIAVWLGDLNYTFGIQATRFR